MSEELKPCPFCGGEARFETYGGTACAVVCQTCGCGTPTMLLDDGMIAADLWNHRAERTCRMVRARCDDGECVWGCRCTACGDRFTYETGTTWRYCPACGAKVVEEES